MRINYVLSTSLLTCGIRTFAEIMRRLEANQHQLSITLPEESSKSFVWEVDAILGVLADEGLSERLRKVGPSRAKESTWDKTADSFDRVFRGETR